MKCSIIVCGLKYFVAFSFLFVVAVRPVKAQMPGYIDLGFTTGTGTGANGNVQALALQPDGKLLVAGQF